MRLITALVVLTFSSTLCFADGDCPSRPATAQERSVYASTYAAAVAAAAPAPGDWVRKDGTKAGGGDAMPDCPGGAKGAPFHYQFRFLYEFNQAVLDQAASAAAQNAMKGTPEQQARIAELDAQHEKLVAERKEARRSGDRARVDRIREELRAVNDERNKVQDEITKAYVARVSSGEVAKATAAAVPARTSAETVIFVNTDRAWVPQGSESLSIAGAPYAYWRPNDSGSLVLLLGAWNPTSPIFRAVLRNAAVITTAQTMIVEIRAERQMAEMLARDMKLELLKAQMKQ